MATVFNDTFTGSSADINGRTPDTAGTSWTKQSYYSAGVMAIIAAGGRLRGDTSSWQAYYATDDPGDDDYTVEAAYYVASVAANYPLVMARWDTTVMTGYGLLYNKDTTRWELVRYNSTTQTPLGTNYSQTLTPGVTYTPKLAVSGTGGTVSLEVTIDGVSRITASDSDASRIVARGKGGIANFGNPTDSTGIHYDSFNLANAAGGGPTISLPPRRSTLPLPILVL